LKPLLTKLGALAAAVTAAGCAPSPQGELLVAFATDMAPPKDLDKINVVVLSGGKNVYSGAFGPTTGKEIALPATLALLVSDDPARRLDIRVTGDLGAKSRVEASVQTTIPEDRVALLRVPLQYLCSSPNFADDPDSGCPTGQTCFAGACRSNVIDERALPDYADAEVFGSGRCFDVASCFAGAQPAQIDDADCTLPAAGDVNLAIAAEGDGACGPAGCFVAFDAESEGGWVHEGGRIKLPKSVCEQRARSRFAGPGVVVAPVTAACPLKRESLPPCGAWSSAGAGAVTDPDAPTVLAGWQHNPVSLAVDAAQQRVYWIEQGAADAADGTVKSLPFTGGTPVVLAEAQAVPRSLVVVPNDRVLWTNRGVGERDGAVMQVKIVGGTVAPLRVDRPRPEGIAVNEDTVFWTQWAEGSFEQGLRGARAPALLADASGRGFAYRIAAAQDLACATNYGADPAAGRVTCWGLTGAERTSYNLGDAEATPQAIAIETDAAGNATYVFWANFGSGEIVVGTPGDMPSRRVVVRDQKQPNGIAIDKDHVYWTNRGDGTVMRVSRADTAAAPEVLARRQRNPGAIAVTANAIFWINEGSQGAADGAVLRMSKP
jgi:hypothetical protein